MKRNNSKVSEMKVEMRDVDTIKPYPGNPRINDGAVDAVAKSIEEFGFRQPIVVDGKGVIIVGHTRFKAALKLGMSQVPVHVAKDLTPQQVKAYRLADNKTNELADWDYELLPIELKDLRKEEYDLSVIGFDQATLDAIMADIPKDNKAIDETELSQTKTECPKCGFRW
jgi:ParB-like chromosome segregation protein Spo0J